MNIHTTPQTVGTHNNTHQYIKIWQRGSCQLVSFLGCIHHTHTHGIARIGICPPWKGPEGVVHKHMFFQHGSRRQRQQSSCVGVGARVCKDYVVSTFSARSPSMCCCFDLCGHSSQYKSCPTMFRMRQLARYAHWGGNSGWWT